METEHCKHYLFFILILALTSGHVSAQNVNKGIWISPDGIAQLPTSGTAWNQVKQMADSDFGRAQGGHNDFHDVNTLGQALVAARLGLNGAGASYRAKVADNLMSAIGSENNGNALSLGRNLPSYVIAADIIDFAHFDSGREKVFRKWLSDVRYKVLDSRWIIEASEDRPNNWGLMTLAARVAVAVYLMKNGVPSDACQGLPEQCRQPQQELERVAQIFKGWCGDRSSYTGFKYGSLSWQSDESNPVGINPKGATKNGQNVDGVLPDDQRRAGGFKWPPPKEGYVYEALQAVLVTSVILYRQGYDVWNWQDKAILRAYQWLHKPHFSNGQTYPAQGDDTWQLHVVNYYYGTNFPAPVPANRGKNMGWTDWTHSERSNNNNNPITSISGRVINSVTADPVANAIIILKTGSTVRYQSSSNASGQFSFENIDPGTYNIECSRDSFQPWNGSVTVLQDQQIFLQDILLTPTNDSNPPQPPQNVKVASGENKS